MSFKIVSCYGKYFTKDEHSERVACTKSLAEKLYVLGNFRYLTMVSNIPGNPTGCNLSLKVKQLETCSLLQNDRLLTAFLAPQKHI